MGDPVALDVLAIAAHPDDVEITCGGLLIKMAARGRKTGVLDLTQGEMGTYGDKTDRAEEAAKAAEVMGLSWRSNLGLPDSALSVTQQAKLKIAQVIRQTRPELVILPHWEQRHPDHLVCSRLGYEACFLAGLRKLDVEGEPSRPRKIIYASYFKEADFSFLVDISEHMETKLKAVAAYYSQFGDTVTNPESDAKSVHKDIFAPGVTIADLMLTRGAYYGQLGGVQYAEAYSIKERILIDDPQKMPIRSI